LEILEVSFRQLKNRIIIDRNTSNVKRKLEIAERGGTLCRQTVSIASRGVAMGDSDRPEKTAAMTRRDLLQRIGIAGGAAAVYDSAVAMGLLQMPAMAADAQTPAEGSGAGQTVAILGAGTGGLTTAYELVRRGFTVSVFEAQDHVGGRTWTARRGTKVVEGGFTDPDRGPIPVTEQTCDFDGDLWLNLGAGRIPYHHRRVLDHCRGLNVALEPYVMTTTANLFQKNGTVAEKAQPRRRLDYDTRGRLAALLAARADEIARAEGLSAKELANFRGLLRAFGDLDSTSLAYTGSTRTGCASGPSVTQPCAANPAETLQLKQLLAAEFWNYRFYQPDDFLWQPTLFQPIGGMDKIAQAFEAELNRGTQRVWRNTEVTQIRLGETKVGLTLRDRKAMKEITGEFDYCISSIPLPVLKTIPANFASDFAKAVAACKFEEACKVGWQVNRRFWEDDPYQIYGGISYIDHEIVQMWYPSDEFSSGRPATMTGAYNYGAVAETFGEKNLATRLNDARSGAVRLHPEYADTNLVPQSKGISIAWQNIAYQRGGWSDWKTDQTQPYQRLLFPDRRFFVVGDQMSTLPGWQEGAMMSSEWVLDRMRKLMDGVEAVEVPPTIVLPDVQRMTQGLM
jgi:monoamine oxidase